jgi:hypothetical protein
MTTSIYDRIVNLQCNSCFHFLSDIEWCKWEFRCQEGLCRSIETSQEIFEKGKRLSC